MPEIASASPLDITQHPVMQALLRMAAQLLLMLTFSARDCPTPRAPGQRRGYIHGPRIEPEPDKGLVNQPTLPGQSNIREHLLAAVTSTSISTRST